MPLFLSRPSGPIEGPLGKCDACGKSDMYVSYFTSFLLERRCSECGAIHKSTPPPINKKLIYLDQWVISQFTNALDPILKEHKSTRLDAFWGGLYEQIERLVKLHVIACPESPIHERESVVTPYFKLLRSLYEHLAAGLAFGEPLAIHAIQLQREFRRVVKKQDIDALAVRSGVLRGTVNEWSDDIRIHVRFGEGGGALERQHNKLADDHLLLDTENWRSHPQRTFADWFEYHRRDIANVAVSCHKAGIFGIYTNASNAMLHSLVYEGESPERANKIVLDFLASDEAASVPFCQISALLFAGMSRAVTAGQKKPANHGHQNDIYAIAAFLPYVDAICVDSYFAEILRSGDVAARMTQFKAKVFGANQREDFLEYLQSLERSTSADLKDTVLAVYGAGWLRPYTGILKYQRAKTDERNA